MPNPKASKEWKEQISPNEAQRQSEFSDQLGRVQSKLNRKFGAGRALHRKQLMAVHGTLKVLAGLPKYASHGLFTEPATYPTVIRLSNGSPSIQNDAVPDVRGFALSVRDVAGPGALGGQTDRQDFLLINRASFGFRTSEEFAEVVVAAMTGQVNIAKALVKRYGSVKGAIQLGRLFADTARPFSGFGTATFYSAAPIQVGPYAARVRLVPSKRNRSLSAQLGFGNEMAARLRNSEVSYALMLDFFVDEEVTPIEDASKAWPLDKCPSVHVATLTLNKQDVSDPDGEALSTAAEKDRFDPWSALAEHRPLGEVMRARKVAYFASQKNRVDS